MIAGLWRRALAGTVAAALLAGGAAAEMRAFDLDAATRGLQQVLAAVEAEESARSQPAIWWIEKPGGGRVTLFGSVHMLPEGHEWRTKELTAAYEKADVIVLETDLAEMQEPGLMAYLASKSLNPPGITLSSLLSEEQKAIVAKGAVKAGISLSWMEGFRPWFVAMQMSVAYAVAQGFSPDQGVDKVIESEGQEDGKAFDYFEAPREQLDLFIELPNEQQINFLVIGAKELVERPDELKKLVNAWATGDTDAIDALMNAGMEEVPQIAKALLQDRNARWAKKIRNFYLKDKNSYLIVVGAGHLVGEYSVPAMLREAGIEVEGP